MVTDVKFEVAENFEAVGFERIKKHLRVDLVCTDEDDLIRSFLEAAIEVCENYIGGHIASKDMVITLDAFDSPLAFEAFPMQSVASVEYYPKDNEIKETMSSTNYSLTNANSKVFNLRFREQLPELANRFDAVTITVKVGFASGKVPKPIQQAILLKIADMYERRDDRAEVISTTSQALLRPYKKF